MPGLAVFDVDHTITRHSTGRQLVQCGIRAGLFSVGHLVSLPYHYLRYRAGVINVERATTAIMRLKGRTLAELDRISVDCFHARVLRDVTNDARARIEAHLQNGDQIAIASSSIGLIVAPLAAELSIATVLATGLEFDKEVATGRLATPPCFGDEKRDRVIALAAALRIPMEAVTFYSDSRLDLPLLRSVGTPVAVNPDRRLRRAAQKHGWEIALFR